MGTITKLVTYSSKVTDFSHLSYWKMFKNHYHYHYFTNIS